MVGTTPDMWCSSCDESRAELLPAPPPGQHTVTIKHDPESHEIEGCHDDCEAIVQCTGVTDECRTWWECTICRDTYHGLDEDGRDQFDEDLYETEVAHGVEHKRIDGMWMTPSNACLSRTLDNDAGELAYTLPDGEHPVDIDCDEGFVTVTATAPEGAPA